MDAALSGLGGRRICFLWRLLGPHVGFYGGIAYGFGYFGFDFVGGRWDGDRFFYNRSVTNIDVVNETSSSLVTEWEVHA